jgi:hypothetical protein
LSFVIWGNFPVYSFKNLESFLTKVIVETKAITDVCFVNFESPVLSDVYQRVVKITSTRTDFYTPYLTFNGKVIPKGGKVNTRKSSLFVIYIGMNNKVRKRNEEIIFESILTPCVFPISDHRQEGLL